MSDPRTPMPAAAEGRVWAALGAIEAQLRSIALTTVGGASSRIPTTTNIGLVSAGIAGAMILDTSTNIVYVDTGTAWKAV